MGAMGVVRILAAMVLFAAPVAAIDQPTLTYSRQDLSADLVSGQIKYENLVNLQVAGGLSLPTQMVLVPLRDGQSAAELSFQSNTELLGMVDSALLADITTALKPERYSRIVEKRRVNRPGLQAVEIIDETTINERRYVRIQVFPVSVDPSGNANLNRELVLRLADTPVSSTQVMSLEQAESLGLNQGTAELSPSGTGPEYVIVTTPALAPAMQRLATFKIALGIQTEVRLIGDMVATTTGRDMAERLREALKNAYQAGCKYVLLAGDETRLPVRYAYPYADTPTPDFEEIQITDLYFADVHGDWNADNDALWGERYFDHVDQTAELMIGRLPFGTVEEANAYVDKLIIYETDPGRGNRSYLNNVMFFTSDQMRDAPYGSQHIFVGNGFSTGLAVDTVTGVEQSSGFDANPTNFDAPTMVDVLGTGYGFVNVQAHGAAGQFAVRTSGYDESNKSCIVTDPNIPGHGPITNLAENDRTGFWYTLACDNGAFDMDTPPNPFPTPSMAQTVLALQRSGAVAMIAYSRYGWVALSYLQQRTFVDTLMAHPDRPAIKAFYAEKAVHASYRDLVYGQNFYGDPTLHIYTSVPKRLAVETAMEDDDVVVMVTEDMVPVSGASVIVSQNGTILGRFSTDGYGRVNLGQSLTGVEQYTISATKAGCSSSIVGYLPYIATDVTEDGDALPMSFELSQNYPNPFNPSTVIRFALPRAAQVKLTVYNVLGQEVATLLDGQRSAGSYDVSWDATSHGAPVASGVYYCRFETGDFVQTRKMVLAR